MSQTQDWSGYLADDTAEHIAELFRQMLEGKLFVYSHSTSRFGSVPSIQTGLKFIEARVLRNDGLVVLEVKFGAEQSLLFRSVLTHNDVGLENTPHFQFKDDQNGQIVVRRTGIIEVEEVAFWNIFAIQRTPKVRRQPKS